MSDKELKLTTVKVLAKLYNEFKHKSLDNNFTLQKLVNRSIHLYNTDTEYQGRIENANLVNTGSYHL